MRRLLCLGLAAPWLMAATPSTPPAPVDLTSTEVTQIAGREVVVRTGTDSTTGGAATGVIDVGATVDATWAAVMDLGARVDEINGLKKSEILEQTASGLTVRWTMKVLAVTVVFHVAYTLDRANGWVHYQLDDRYDNDLVAVVGSYQLYEVGDGSTRLVFRSETDSGRRVPQWINRWLTTESLGQQLTGIRARAESGP